MALSFTTDHDAIRARLLDAVGGDPVRGTIFGTLATSLGAGAWAAWDDDGSLAVRSDTRWWVVLAGPWASATALGAALLEVAPRGLSGARPLVEHVLAALPARPVERHGQLLYRLDALVSPTVSGRARVAGPSDLALVVDWYRAFGAELGEDVDPEPDAQARIAAGLAYLWLDPAGAPVAMALRRPVVAGSARVGPVYTPPACRGHGYASGVTAAATASILADCAVPVLFTDLDNPTSNKIYRALGYTLVEERLVAKF